MKKNSNQFTVTAEHTTRVIRTKHYNKKKMKILVEAEKFPSLLEWAQKFNEILLIKECLPPRDALADYFNIIVIYWRSNKKYAATIWRNEKK
jgi:glutathione S-transferase